MSKRTIPMLCALAGALSFSAFAGTTSGSGSMTGAESTMSPRFFRDGVGGAACSQFSSGSFQYQAIDLTSDASGTMTATFDPQTCGTGVFVTFHSPAFNPADICSGHLWSFGSSQAFSGQSFSVPANSPVKMVVSGVANAPGVACGPFTYSVSGTGSATFPDLVQGGLTAIDGMKPASFGNPAQKNSMILLLRTALQYAGNPATKSLALGALDSVIKNTDGCALRTAVDGPTFGAGIDYIKTCPDQATVYPPLKAARDLMVAP